MLVICAQAGASELLQQQVVTVTASLRATIVPRHANIESTHEVHRLLCVQKRAASLPESRHPHQTHWQHQKR